MGLLGVKLYSNTQLSLSMICKGNIVSFWRIISWGKVAKCILVTISCFVRAGKIITMKWSPDSQLLGIVTEGSSMSENKRVLQVWRDWRNECRALDILCNDSSQH